MSRLLDGRSHSDWLQTSAKIEASELGCEVAEVVGTAMAGLYHLNDRDLHASEWNHPRMITVRLSYRALSTYDPPLLSMLVVLATDHMLRLEIRPRSRTTLSLCFWKRGCREGGSMYERLPSMERLTNMARKAEDAGSRDQS